jgi:antitoxin component of MazEF toxin-antitoxin module
MVKKLTRLGNSLAVLIDKPILELLNITADTPIELTTDGRRLIVTPLAAVHDEAVAAGRRLTKGHAKNLGRLATQPRKRGAAVEAAGVFIGAEAEERIAQRVVELHAATLKKLAK